MLSASRGPAALTALLAAALAATAGDGPPAGERRAREALATFEKGWKQPKGLMPPGDASWKVRLEALVALLKEGQAAVPVLTRALKGGPAPTRAFAAQVLGLLGDPEARPALLGALEDPDPCVRLQAAQALGLGGRLDPTPLCRRIAEEDPSWLVQAQVAFALKREGKADLAALRKALTAYDLAAADSAAVGKPAPAFSLEDAFGKAHALKDHRGKRAVVLVFLALDV